MHLGLAGKKVLVTGATRGIGRSLLKTFVEEGADVSCCARSRQTLSRVLAEYADSTSRVIGESVDVSDVAALQAWIDRSAEALGGVDVFVSNVSAMGGPDKWQQVFELDVLGTVRGIEAVLPHMRVGGAGAIVLINSTAAVETFRGPTAYAAFKAGLLNYAKNLSRELARESIRVNSVVPGPVFVEGGAWDQIRAEKPEEFEKVLADLPMGRMASPEDVARAVVFLASEAASYVSGTALVVDGGFTRRVQY
ncbi:SDR family NAD(P)-dependent oxidoreductase [Leucobacter sp. Z1108]|uniref:SDR family NAD(P)-dependent oxidoreductase n=1 Tax=Leucobacter sp. Z1108 TaxID=3439066 RepID=UPI003F3A5E6C